MSHFNNNRIARKPEILPAKCKRSPPRLKVHHLAIRKFLAPQDFMICIKRQTIASGSLPLESDLKSKVISIIPLTVSLFLYFVSYIKIRISNLIKDVFSLNRNSYFVLNPIKISTIRNTYAVFSSFSRDIITHHFTSWGALK